MHRRSIDYSHLPLRDDEEDKKLIEVKRQKREVDLAIRRKKNLSKTEEEKIQEGIFKIILQSNDGVDVVFDSDAAFQCRLIKKMIADLGITDGNDPLLADAIPIYQVDGWTLNKLRVWCEENRDYVHIEKDTREDQRVPLTEHEKKYLDVSSEELFKMATNFLDLPGAMEICCQRIANMIEGKSIKEIREIYGLQNDYSPEEEAQMEREVEEEIEEEEERRARQELKKILGLQNNWDID